MSLEEKNEQKTLGPDLNVNQESQESTKATTVEPEIKIFKLSVSDIPSFLTDVFKKPPYNQEEVKLEQIFNRNLESYLKLLKPELWVVAEYPYVDKFYRDTYYHFFSSKLHSYPRDTVRLSFFLKELPLTHFRKKGHLEEIQKEYLGFIVIRPTFPKVIGRSAVAPQAFKDHNFLCCTAKVQATCNYIKLYSNAFPHASQDNQLVTCSETTIWSLFEYFGNKYPEYKPTLPSEIHRKLQQYSYKRQIPSDGLTVDQLTFVVRELGFGSLSYSKEEYPERFNEIISMYVESGIPVIGVVRNDHIAHAVNIVGREVDNIVSILNQDTYEEVSPQVRLIDYHQLERKYVLVDDNHPPYREVYLDAPTAIYSSSLWIDCDLTDIVVPLYHKIYLDALKAKDNFLGVLELEGLGVDDNEPRVFKVFLASGRSYKEYIALNNQMEESLKELILTIAFPKFIWVAEIAKQESFEKGFITGFLLQDATDPVDRKKEPLVEWPMICGYNDGKFFKVTKDDESLQFIDTFALEFEPYTGNLSNLNV